MFTVLLTPAEADDDEKEGDISNGRWGESYAFDPGMLHFSSTTIGVTPTPLKESLLTTPSKVCDPFVPETCIDSLSELAELAAKMIRKAASLGKVVIVTNAQVRLSIRVLKVRRDGKLMHSEISSMVNAALVTKELTESTSMDSINEVYIGPARFDSRVLAKCNFDWGFPTRKGSIDESNFGKYSNSEDGEQLVLAKCNFDWGFPTRKGSIDESNFGKYSDSEDGEQLIDSQRALMSTRRTVVGDIPFARIGGPQNKRYASFESMLILVGSVNGREESSNSNS
ncbi:hypothetical protein Pmar_PMAR018158 [Perkinsus marinus ATCC 50983]|uniref:Uncharacterized protein n=1 Tax=Perkinsus marinus (strain ATCC 50983 / TXsc) TaxID=423536 RepID=C5KFX2_PERM5|nr:hypothetical protein Pmar_PMAR018158 [Perkinsus marinus ATCC 50983]EER16620.1 hypothetical protein Pmar_PMAR018158 [Perkinsus marinus ATCC 50983]|eukprot:XP_002784824.1 hypothetical protein Pmar_PMAR018158 [Perkinsus marinus ATCC 50983]